MPPTMLAEALMRASVIAYDRERDVVTIETPKGLDGRAWTGAVLRHLATFGIRADTAST